MCGVDSSDSGYVLMASSFEHLNELLDSIQGRKFLFQLSDN